MFNRNLPILTSLFPIQLILYFAKLVLIDSLNQINIYQYLTVHQYLVCAELKQHITGPDQYLNNSHRLVILRQTLLE